MSSMALHPHYPVESGLAIRTRENQTYPLRTPAFREVPSAGCALKLGKVLTSFVLLPQPLHLCQDNLSLLVILLNRRTHPYLILLMQGRKADIFSTFHR